MSCVCVLQRGHSGGRCYLASTLYRYDLRKGDLFVLSGQWCDEWGGKVYLQNTISSSLSGIRLTLSALHNCISCLCLDVSSHYVLNVFVC